MANLLAGQQKYF